MTRFIYILCFLLAATGASAVEYRLAVFSDETERELIPLAAPDTALATSIQLTSGSAIVFNSGFSISDTSVSATNLVVNLNANYLQGRTYADIYTVITNEVALGITGGVNLDDYLRRDGTVAMLPSTGGNSYYFSHSGFIPSGVPPSNYTNSTSMDFQLVRVDAVTDIAAGPFSSLLGTRNSRAAGSGSFVYASDSSDADSEWGGVLGGTQNFISTSARAFIFGGTDNVIQPGADDSFIQTSDGVQVFSVRSGVIGSSNSVLAASTDGSFVIGSDGVNATASRAYVLGGSDVDPSAVSRVFSVVGENIDIGGDPSDEDIISLGGVNVNLNGSDIFVRGDDITATGDNIIILGSGVSANTRSNVTVISVDPNNAPFVDTDNQLYLAAPNTYVTSDLEIGGDIIDVDNIDMGGVITNALAVYAAELTASVNADVAALSSGNASFVGDVTVDGDFVATNTSFALYTQAADAYITVDNNTLFSTNISYNINDGNLAVVNGGITIDGVAVITENPFSTLQEGFLIIGDTNNLPFGVPQTIDTNRFDGKITSDAFVYSNGIIEVANDFLTTNDIGVLVQPAGAALDLDFVSTNETYSTLTLFYTNFVGGSSNTIDALSEFSFVGGGEDNSIGLGSWGVVVGGFSNQIYDLVAAVVDADYTFIGGGEGNRVFTVNNANGHVSFSALVGGEDNYIEGERHGFIGGGQGNIIVDDGNSALGGNVIVGGISNKIQNFEVGHAGVIVGGQDNEIFPQSRHGFIGGGQGNRISFTSLYNVIVGGQGNFTQWDYTFIGGGQGNTIGETAFPALYSSIVGGSDNLNNGAYSAIIGGSGNEISFGLTNSVIVQGSGQTLSDNNTALIGNDLRVGGKAYGIFKAQSVTANTTLEHGNVYFVDTSGGDVTVTVPDSASTASLFLSIKKTTQQGKLTIVRSGTELIEGETSIVINLQGEAIPLMSDGAGNWWIPW